jgi:hypothetical protein
MIFVADHGILQPNGLALFFNVAGLLVTMLAAVGVICVKRQKAVALSLALVLVGVAVVICGTTAVITYE